MVAYLFLLTLFLLAPLSGATMSVKISPSYPNQTIQGEISIAHQLDEPVDEASFTVNGGPFQVVKGEDSYPAGHASREKNTPVVTTYRFGLQGSAQGLYLFPAVQVKVGTSIITSAPVSYEVSSIVVSGELQLDARVQERGPFYPGQKITLQYFISFRYPIQLTKETLPLLEFPGFRTVGAPKVGNVSQGDQTVQIISQQAVAQEPGTYNSGISTIEGYIYREDASGNKAYAPALLQAQAPSIQVVVLPFPEQGKPTGFNGAIGVFYYNVKTTGATNVALGEKITLDVAVTGSGDFDTVTFPDLTRQAGFKDVFRLSDLSPVGETKDAQKRFVVNLRPIVSSVKIIPSIEFSSFDPISKTYVVRRSDPIAINVRPSTNAEREEPNLEGMPPPVFPIEIQGNMVLNRADLSTRHMQDILLLYAFILLSAVVGAQYMFRTMYEKSKARGKQSRDIMLEAIQKKNDPEACCKLVRQALLLRLYEVGITKNLVELPQELRTEGLEGEIRKLLVSIEEKRFMGLEAQLELKEIIDEASQLYYRMKG